MELKEVYNKLLKLKIPVAYRLFETAPASLPFCVYYVENRHLFGADDKNMLERHTIVIELYSQSKDLKLENKIREMFKEYEIDITENYIDSEKMFMNTFSFETITKI